MASEFWRSDSPGDVALKLTPEGRGRLEVYLDGEKIFDHKDDNEGFPNLPRVTELKMTIAEKVFDVEEALANG